MLQRRRAGAKLSTQCSLRHTPFVVSSYSCKVPIKTCHSTLAHLPTENSASKNVEQRIYPSRLNEWNKNRRSQGILTLGCFRPDAFMSPIKRYPSARFFSHSRPGYQNQDQNHTIERRVFRDKPLFSMLGINVLRRNITTWRKLTPKALLASRLQALGNAIGEIKERESLARANECLSYFENAIKDVSAPRNQVKPHPAEPRRNITTSRKATPKALLAERLHALEKTIGNIQERKKLELANECLSVFEDAVRDVFAPKNQVEHPPAEPPVEQLEMAVEERTTTTTVEAVTKTTMSFQAEPGQVLLESLEFTPEPEPYDPLTEYQIPIEVLQQRQLLERGVNKTWSHSLYQNKDGNPPTVHYCKNIEDANEVAALFLKDKAVGFDLEWDPWAKVDNPSPRSQVSLMQIANQSDIALFHISLFDSKSLNGFIPKNLRKLLLSEDILKVGVNVGGDALRMYKYLNITMQGIFELSDFKNLLDTVMRGGGYIPKRMISLANLTEETLLLPLAKGKVRRSQWKKLLTTEQTQYAAADAYAGLRVFDALLAQRSKLRPCPPLPKCRVLSVQQEGIKKVRRASKTSIPTETSGESEKPIAKAISDLENDLRGIGGVLEGPQAKGVVEAEKWVTKYMEKEGTLVASRPQLRAYAMWYDGGYGVEEISELWSNRPIQLRTVADYILKAIRLESLPYEKEKVKELIEHAGPITTFPWEKKVGLKRWM